MYHQLLADCTPPGLDTGIWYKLDSGFKQVKTIGYVFFEEVDHLKASLMNLLKTIGRLLI
jgi:hypothetical protein